MVYQFIVNKITYSNFIFLVYAWKISIRTLKIPLTIMDIETSYPFHATHWNCLIFCNLDPLPINVNILVKLLHWIWGYQTRIPPINLSSPKKKEIFYAAGPVAICFDWMKNKQYLLQGHKNDIKSIAASPDKNFLVSADCGEENALIIWHAGERQIFHIIYDYFPKEGVVSMCFSYDGNELMTLTGKIPQELYIWQWKSKKMFPDVSYKYKETAEYQHFVTFHPLFSTHFASCGHKSVYFFENDNNEVKSALLHVESLYDEKASKQMGNFTQTAFISSSLLAVTATTKGTIILWGKPLYKKQKPALDSKELLLLSPEQRVCIRMIQVMEPICSISFLSSVDKYFIAASANGEILYYDENISVQWSKCFNTGPINGVSFTYKPPLRLKGAVKKLRGKAEEMPDSPFERTDFIISTVQGLVVYYTVSTKELKDILWGTDQLIKSVALHPVWNYIYFGDNNGRLQKWNYTTKELLSKDVYQSLCSEIEVIAADNKGAYIACVMSNGNLAIFDAVCFTSQPCFTADEVLYKPTMIKFSPDSQHLLITDVSSYVTQYHLQLLVVPEEYRLMHKDKIPSEEPFWSYSGKSRQHQGYIIDCMFNYAKQGEALYFYTLGEDHFLVEYSISNSKGLDIDIAKRILLEWKPVPTCMTWYPIYDVSGLIGILNDDGKMRVYSIETEKVVKIISLPVFEEPIKRIILQKKFKYLLAREFPHCTNISEVFQYFLFNCSHVVGLSKFPIDGNPNTSLGLTCTPSGINYIVPNKEQTYLFTTGLNDSWIYMYQINILAVLESEREGGEGIEALKYLFPSDCDPDDMKNKLVYGVYSLELEKKLLEFGKDSPALKGEIPVAFLQYVLAVIGCFVTPNDLQLMLRDIEFESEHCYNGEKKFLSHLDIMKLYINYRPSEPVTINKLQKSFSDVLSLEENPNRMTRARFIDVLTARGDAFSPNELLDLLKCLKGFGNFDDMEFESPSESKRDSKNGNKVSALTTETDSIMAALNELIPEYINESMFFRDVLCLEKVEENLSKYVLKKEDYERVQEYPVLKDFIDALEKE